MDSYEREIRMYQHYQQLRKVEQAAGYYAAQGQGSFLALITVVILFVGLVVLSGAGEFSSHVPQIEQEVSKWLK